MSLIADLSTELGVPMVDVGKLIKQGASEDDIRLHFRGELNEEGDFSFDGFKYFFHNIKGFDDSFAISMRHFENIIYDYVRDGNDMSLTDLSIEHSLDVSIIRAMFKRYGVTKDHPIRTRERIEEIQSTHLYNDIVQSDASVPTKNFKRDVDRAKLSTLERENNKLSSQIKHRKRFAQDCFEGMVQTINDYKAPPKVEKTTPTEKSLKTVFQPWVDFHFNKLVDGNSYGSDYNLEVAETRAKEITDNLVAFIMARGGHCETVHLSDLGDTAHSRDGFTDKNTKVGADKDDRHMFRSMARSKRYQIDSVRSISDMVVVTMTYGNHFSDGEFYLYEYLKAAYEDCDDVVFIDRDKPQNYFKEGNTIHLLDHGDGLGANISSETTVAKVINALHAIVDDSDEPFHYVCIWIGHRHTAATASVGGRIKLYRLEAMCEPDEWSSQNRWDSDPCYHIFVLDENGRPCEDHIKYFTT